MNKSNITPGFLKDVRERLESASDPFQSRLGSIYPNQVYGLLEFAEGIVNKGPWTAAKDQMPDHYDRVLICWQCEGQPRWALAKKQSNTHWGIEGPLSMSLRSENTYWMMPPAPPIWEVPA